MCFLTLIESEKLQSSISKLDPFLTSYLLLQDLLTNVFLNNIEPLSEPILWQRKSLSMVNLSLFKYSKIPSNFDNFFLDLGHCRSRKIPKPRFEIPPEYWISSCIGGQFYKGSDLCVLTFDITKSDTLKSLDTWKASFLEHAAPEDQSQVSFIVLGENIWIRSETGISLFR